MFRAAFDSGITLYDTADAYGTGTAERLIGETLSGKRDQITLVSKWGNTIDEEARQFTGQDATPEYIRTAIQTSLTRLRTDHIDLYLLHLSGLAAAEAAELLGALQELVTEGSIRRYGWSTDDPELAATWQGRPGFRGPGVRNQRGARRARAGRAVRDPRGARPGPGPAGHRVTVRHVLTSGGRTPAQGALAWLWHPLVLVGGHGRAPARPSPCRCTSLPCP